VIVYLDIEWGMLKWGRLVYLETIYWNVGMVLIGVIRKIMGNV
jgi:hypothetical protein